LTVEYDSESRQVQVDRRSNDRRSRAFHGLHRSLIQNMVQGVTEGFEKKLELYGTGYSANMRGSDLVLQVGFCHEVVVEMPEGVTAEVEQTNAQLDRPATFSVKGADKQAVGQIAASIRDIRPPEPYKGKGIRYTGEYVRRKEGKAFTGAG
jgi:large subunit ribosomal protein L6